MALAGVYERLVKDYGWTREYINGQWNWVCELTGNRCCKGFSDMCSRANCYGPEQYIDLELRKKALGGYARPILYGLTRPMFLMYWSIAQKRQLDDLNIEMKLHGIDPDGDGNKDTLTKKDAKDFLDDPFKDFPNDVDYSSFTDEFIDKQIKYYESVQKAYQKKNISIPNTINLWTKERVAAFRSGDVLLKRVSINFILWSMYRELVNKGVKVDQVLVLKLLRWNWTRYQLYPNSSNIEEYKKGKTANEIKNIKIVSYEDDPPKWFIQKLHDEGRLDSILAKIREILNG